MRTRSTVHLGRAALIAPVALVIAAGVISGSSAGARPEAPAVTAAHHPAWTQISSGTQLGLSQPAVARFGKDYEAVWVQKVTPSSFAIRARILDAAGHPKGGVIDVLDNWSELSLDPTILSAGGQRVIAFAGQRVQSPDPYNTDAEYYLTSSDGKHWSLQSDVLSPAGAGTDVGTAVAAYSTGFLTGLARSGQVEYYLGPSSQDPPSSFSGSTDSTGNGTSEPGVAVAGNKAWFAWYSDTNSASQNGVSAQQVLPTKGPRLHAAASHSGITSYGAQQDLSLVARTGSTDAPYTAFGAPPAHQAVVVWQIGASKPLLHISSPGFHTVSLAAGPKGRLWVVWQDTKGWHATRSNRSATRFEPISRVSLPASSGVGDLASVGSAGPLEAISEQTPYKTGHTLVYAHLFRPRLSCSASPSKVKPGQSFTVKVTDAGDAVPSATVHALGAKKKTTRSGKAKLRMPRHGASTAHITVSLAGYVGCSATVRVKGASGAAWAQ